MSIFQPGVVDQSPLQALIANMAKLLATFTICGDTLWRYNIAGRPIFVGAVALLFYVGLIVCLRRTIGRHSASVLVLAWLVVMLFPSALSWDVGAYTFRSMGLVPMLFLLPAIAYAALWDAVVGRAARSWLLTAQWAFPACAAVILVVEGAMTYRDYFLDWANSFGSAYENMEDTVAAARYLSGVARPGEEDIFVSSEYFGHPVVAHLAPTC